MYKSVNCVKNKNNNRVTSDNRNNENNVNNNNINNEVDKDDDGLVRPVLTAKGIETLHAFLRRHGNDYIRQFVQVSKILPLVFT